MKKYLNKAKHCIKGFTMAKFHQIPLEENTDADSLAKVASAYDLIDDQIKIQYILSLDIPEVQQIDKEVNWTTLIMSYLKDGLLPEDKEEARKLRVRVAKFVLMDEVLYKRSLPTLPMMLLHHERRT